MEAVQFSNKEGLTLRGILQRGTNDRLIIMCHGFRSNRSSHGRFDQFTTAFVKEGYHVLRFDFGGCGESDDQTLSLKGEVEDLKSAIEYVVALGYKQIALYGHSLGARVCLESYTSSYIKTMILTGAGTGPVHYDWTEEFSGSQLHELEDTGVLTQPVEDPYRDHILISKQMLLAFEQVNQMDLLSRIECPVLIIHGDQGEEKQLMPLTRNGMKWLPDHSRMKVIEGAAHSFDGYLDAVEENAVLWLREHF